MPFNEEGRKQFFEFQQVAAYVVGHPRLRDVLEELEGNEEVFRANEKEPRPYFAERGFDLPESATVSISHNSPVTIVVCVNGHCVSVDISVSVDVFV
jgi:hypothetical protein